MLSFLYAVVFVFCFCAVMYLYLIKKREIIKKLKCWKININS